MATRSNSNKGSKSVMDHDPLANAEEGVEAQAEETADAKPPQAKKTVKKKVAKKKAVQKKPEPSPVELEELEARDFELGESLTIGEVADSHKRLQELLGSGGSISLDGSAVEGIDGAGLQLLAAFMQDAKGQGIEVSWSGVSDTLEAAASQVGLTDVLGVSGG